MRMATKRVDGQSSRRVEPGRVVSYGDDFFADGPVPFELNGSMTTVVRGERRSDNEQSW
jgi:hypothetical protein